MISLLKKLSRLFAIAILVFIFMISISSCFSQKGSLNSRHVMKNKTKTAPISKKKEPLPKNFKLKSTKQSILGQEHK
jgi:hypothetical protein